MRHRIPTTTTLLALLVTWPAVIGAQEGEEATRATPDPVRFETTHSGVFNGRRVEYSAVVSDVQLKRDDGTPYASVFTTAYLADGGAGDAARPVTFVFNGGPGSSSIWLHMGMFGPRRAVVPSDASHPGGAPYPVADNPHGLLDATDLVFIDPPGTGFSRLIGDGKPEEVYGLREDARTVAGVIREWVRREGRWNAPIYIAGESFGTTRAAAVLPQLMRGSEPLGVSGVILISQALDYAGSSPYVDDNLISFVTYLPTMAATAWYHGKVDRGEHTLESFLDAVRVFAIDEYLPALWRGSSLSDVDERTIAERYAAFTGLSTEYVLRSRLRVNSTRFVKELLREEGLAIGRLDGRYTSDEIDDVAERPSWDAASAAISAAYSAALHQYLADELRVTLDRPYNVSGPEVGRNWVWDRGLASGGEPVWVNTARDMAWALSFDPSLRVMVASGYYDYATPFFDAEFTFWRHGIDMDRVTMTYYEAGHMMYVHEPSLEAVTADVRGFILGGR